MDGDDLHQFPLGFEAQYLLSILPVGAAHRLPQPAQQGILPVQLAAHLLQQLAEMEEVGQPPLAIGARQQRRGEIAPVQQGPQHGQHAAAVPDLAVLHKLLHRALPRPLVAGQPIERLGIEIKQAGRQRRPQAALFARVLAGVQNQQDLPRLRLLQHALAVRQIDGGDGEPRQLLLHQLALGAGAHQHGDIPGLDRLIAYLRLALAGQRQQAVDLGGGGAGHLALVIPPIEGGLAGQLPAVEHGGGGAIEQQRLALALRLHRQEGDIRLVDKGILGPLEQAVDRPHQRTAGAPVAPEGVVGDHISPRLNVGKDVGAAKAVDGLLGVTDHQQRRVCVAAVEAMEDAVLLGVGILKFIDHRHPIGGANTLAEPLAKAGAERPIEVFEQVIKRELMSLTLAGLHPAAHHFGRPLQDEIPNTGAARQQLVDLAEQRQGRHSATLLEILFQHSPAKALQLLRDGVATALVLCPVGYLGKPPFVVLAGVAADLAVGLAADLVRLRQPFTLHRRDAAHGRLMASGEGLVPQRGVDLQLAVVEPAAHLPQQGGGARPERAHRAGEGFIHRIELGAPVVAHRLQPELAVVGKKFGFKEGARLEGVLFQHPLAEAVDGEDRRLVHLPLGGQQAAGRQLVIHHLCQQLGQQGIIAMTAHKGEPRLVNATADPPAQLGGGRFGKGHHQNFGHRERPFMGARLTRIGPLLNERAVAQQQAQVETGDGVGLAGTGGGFDQSFTMEGKTQGIERVSHYFSSSRVLSSGVRCSRASACNCPSTSSSSSGKQRAT